MQQNAQNTASSEESARGADDRMDDCGTEIGKSGTVRFKHWLNEWLELYIKVSAKERTYKKYRQQVEKYILPYLGNYDVNELSAVTLQRFSVSLTQMDLASSSVSFIVSVLKASLKKGVTLGVIDRQFADAIVRPKIYTGKVACFSKEEQKKIERYIFEKRQPFLYGIILCLYSGLRVGELLALTWEDIDFQKGTMSITKSCHDSWVDRHYVKIIESPKTDSSVRTIPLPKQIIGHLKMLKRRTGAKFVVVGKSEYGAQIRSYQRTFDIVLKKLNIPHKGIHALRHTFATRALEVGMDIKTLSEILGHKNPTITLQRYAHSLMEHKTEMMNKVGRLLS